MLPDRFVKEPHSSRGQEPDCDPATLIKDEANELSVTAPPRPFRERRRTRSIEDSRHEALHSLDRLLMHHERTIEDLRAEKDKYRAIFEEALTGIFQMSPTWHLLSVNRMMARIHGYDTPEQLQADAGDIRLRLLVDPGQLKEWRSSVEKSDAAV